MKTIVKIFFLFLVGIVVISCKSGNKDYKPISTGHPYDVLAIMPENRWEGDLGDTLRAILREEIPMFNQPEPLFSLYYSDPSKFKRAVRSHRSLIMFNISEDYKEPAIGVQYDVYSMPQIVVTVVGNNLDSMIGYMSEHRSQLQRVLGMAERDWYVASVEKKHEQYIESQIRDKFGFSMMIPMAYRVRNNSIKDFMWLSLEYPLAAQGILIYSYPYESGSGELTISSLLQKRNQYTSLIPGPSEGSYMTTFMEIPPMVNAVSINDRMWIEMRGFWDVANDFMGGPYVSYSTIDQDNSRIVTLDFYVQSHKYPKRNYVRELESLMFTVEF